MALGVPGPMLPGKPGPGPGLRVPGPGRESEMCQT